MRGHVIWFSEIRGFGFVRAEDTNANGTEYYVHFDDIEREGFRTLTEGEVVEFEPHSDEAGGPKARKVRPVAAV